MKELPLVFLNPRDRENGAISTTAKSTGYLNQNEEATTLRRRLLQMILDNERNRRTQPPASKV